MSDSRRALGPSEFADRCRVLEARHRISQTSGTRTEQRNGDVGGAAQSVHLLPGLARDYGLDDHSDENVAQVLLDVRRLGLWGLYHDKGRGPHLHVQAIPPLEG